MLFTLRITYDSVLSFFFFFFNDTATTEIYTLSLHDALPIYLLHASNGLLAGTKAQAELAAETTHATCQMDQQQSVFLKASGALLDREAQSLDRAGDIVGQQRQFKPSGVDCEVLAGHVSSAQGVFDLVMH